MKKRIHKMLALTYWSLCIFTFVGMVLVGDVLAGAFAIVVNKSNNVDNVSFSDLVKYLSAEKHFWPNGKKVAIFLREDGSEEKDMLLKKVYKVSGDELKKMWVGKVYKNEIASPPKTLTSAIATVKAIIDAEGGIGIVKAEELSNDIKILKIDGTSPSDADYPLK